MPTLDEIEHRVSRLESLVEGVLKERLNFLVQRLDQLYEKTERDKTEILAKTERDKTEILTKTEKDKTELLEKMALLQAKTEQDKKEIIYKIGMMLVGFTTLIITSMWALLSFAVK
jgi:hypothetical protein